METSYAVFAQPSKTQSSSHKEAGAVDPSRTTSLPPLEESPLRERKKFFLTEGHILITTVPAEIITVLGSCIAVCLWDRQKKIAGMNHFLLPGNLTDEGANPNRGFSATRMLIKSMTNRKCQLEDLEAKVFGGSNTLQQFEVGKRNTEAALYMLKEAGIPVVASSIGGIAGRKVIFNTRTGKVLMRTLNKSLSELNDEISKGLAV